MAKRIKTTENDFIEFSERLHRYAEWLGLGDWKLYPQHGGTDGNSDGGTSSNILQRKAIIHLAKKIYTTETIAYIAKHEICEVLLSNINWMASCSQAHNSLEEARHIVINQIVRLIDKLDDRE